MLAVLAILAILLAMSVPALNGLTSQAGRRGAVNMVLGAFEQARVAAILNQTATYVVFVTEDQPGNERHLYRAFRIYRDKIDLEGRTNASGVTYDDVVLNLTNDFIPMGKWETLPRGISFWNEPNSLVGANNTQRAVFDAERGATPYVVFNAGGAVVSPLSQPSVLVYEGHYANGQNNWRRAGGGLDMITLARYTGRASLSVSAVTP